MIKSAQPTTRKCNKIKKITRNNRKMNILMWKVDICFAHVALLIFLPSQGAAKPTRLLHCLRLQQEPTPC